MNGEVFAGAIPEEMITMAQAPAAPIRRGLMGMFYIVNGVDGFHQARDFERSLEHATDPSSVRNAVVLDTITNLDYKMIRSAENIQLNHYVYERESTTHGLRIARFCLTQIHHEQRASWHGTPTHVVDTYELLPDVHENGHSPEPFQYRELMTPHDVIGFISTQRHRIDKVG